jgi:uncharacterized cysteine cluster protein YcgN (CxxCxxCC family)
MSVYEISYGGPNYKSCNVTRDGKRIQVKTQANNLASQIPMGIQQIPVTTQAQILAEKESGDLAQTMVNQSDWAIVKKRCSVRGQYKAERESVRFSDQSGTNRKGPKDRSQKDLEQLE